MSKIPKKSKNTSINKEDINGVKKVYEKITKPISKNINYFQSDCPVVYIDTETTGIGKMEDHRIIEIALVKVSNINNFKDHIVFHSYLDIEQHIEITKGAFNVHGISKEILKGKPKFEDIANQILDFLENCIIIGHNVQFDIDFVNASLARMGNSVRYDKLPNKTIDSRSAAAQKFPGKKVGLDSLITMVLKKPPRGHHSALEDALYLAEIYPQLQKEENTNLFHSIKENSQKDEEEEVTFFEDLIE